MDTRAAFLSSGSSFLSNKYTTLFPPQYQTSYYVRIICVLDSISRLSIITVQEVAKEETMNKRAVTCGEKKATLYGCEQPAAPLIILNNYSGDGESVVKAMHEINTPDCNLLVVGNLNWDHDMTPWYCPPLSKNDTPCTGGADAYLDLLLTKILPKVKETINGTPCFVGIAG